MYRPPVTAAVVVIQRGILRMLITGAGRNWKFLILMLRLLTDRHEMMRITRSTNQRPSIVHRLQLGLLILSAPLCSHMESGQWECNPPNESRIAQSREGAD